MRIIINDKIANYPGFSDKIKCGDVIELYNSDDDLIDQIVVTSSGFEKYAESEIMADDNYFGEFEKDVHTEHCCAIHGCKYGDTYCPVWLGRKKQSFGYWDGDVTHPIPVLPVRVFKERCDRLIL